MRYITVILIWFIISCSQKTNDKEIKVNINGDIYNFGKIIQSDTLRTKFHLRNDLDRNIEIEKLSGSSKQIQVTSNKRILKPKEIATINVEFFTNELNGAQKRQITIKTSNKENPYTKYYIKAFVQKINSYKRERFFDQIINKKESQKNLPDSIAYKFDFSKRFTEKELLVLNLDTTKIGLNEYYFLSDQQFLKNRLDSISFIIYYKHQYGDQLEKILRIKRKDTVFDLTLAMEGGDSFLHSISTEFVNDSTFISTYVLKEGDIISSKNNSNKSVYEYYYETIIDKYHFDKKLNFNLTNRDTTNYSKRLIYENNELINELKISISEPFILNNIKCYWECTFENNELSSQKLIAIKTKQVLLDLDLSKFISLHPHYWEKFDVNKDGKTDIQFTTEIAGAGANTGFASYIFNPTNKIFEYSEVFSGYNINYDSEKNRISTFGKSSVNDYYYSIKNLKGNKTEIEFIERVRHYEDTIYYKKIVNDKIIKEKKIILGEYENWRQHLERK